MKLYLTAVLLLLIADRSIAQDKGLDVLKKLILKECPPANQEDSLQVVNFIDSIHKSLGIKRAKIIKNKTGSSHFVFGTIYINKKAIDTNNVCIVWINEMPHALQFSKAPVVSYLKACKGFLETFINYFFLTKSEKQEVKAIMKEEKCPKWKAKAWVAYKRQYKNPNKFEGVHLEGDPFFASHVRPVLGCIY